MISTPTKYRPPEPYPTINPSELIATAWRQREKRLLLEAETTCRSVLSMAPEHGQALHLLGLLSFDTGSCSEAVQYLSRAIASEPDEPLHHNNLGVIQQAMQQYAKAAESFRQALEHDPDYTDARCNLGLALYHSDQFDAAAQCFQMALATDPHNSSALANLGLLQLTMHDYAGAAHSYEMAIAVEDQHSQWHGNLGAAFMALEKFEDAANCFKRASCLAPDDPGHTVHQAIALRAYGHLSESIDLLKQVISKDPLQSAALAHLVIGLEYTCQWDQLALYSPMLNRATRTALDNGLRPDEDPMLNIRRSDDLSLNLEIARSWSASIHRKSNRVHCAVSEPRVNKIPEGPITIGYLSHDFRNHPVCHQLHPLLKLHDRKRFRVVAFSTGPDDGSRYRREIEAGSDLFYDLKDMGLAPAVHTIRDAGIDILIDLMGHSHHNRMDVLALRPAPVQIGYLGFLSTTGADFIDYLVADSIVVPEKDERYFTEKLIRMPHCYQFNHTHSKRRTQITMRIDCGLPATDFVFCCFNAAYKIDQQLFDAWLQILTCVPNAVLWLNGHIPEATTNMRNRAEKMSVDPERLVFAEKIALERHLERLSLADLALDTLRYNGGATTANALVAGVPVLTVKGDHWVSRMSASHLAAAGMHDLIVRDRRTYVQTAIDLASQPSKMSTLRQKLTRSVHTSPIFDQTAFVRHFEKGLSMVWQRYLNNRAAEHIQIPQPFERDTDV